MAKPAYDEALRRAGALEALAAFDPHVAGTPPLGLDLPGSDIDILCHAPDLNAFAAVVGTAFGACEGFSARRWNGGGEPAVIAGFAAHGWAFEVFGQALPVAEQLGWRHFVIERRLLALGGAALRTAVLQRRRAGLKTEPAFADALQLTGDPYLTLLELEHQTDEALASLLAANVSSR
jgi:hypothetical protein